MPRRDDAALMLQAARLYYEEDRTQAQVARALRTSRPTISRLLQQARQEGIVQIRVVDPEALDGALARELVSVFGLAEAEVITGDTDPAGARRRIGRAAARYLERTLQEGETVGLGWGRTLYELVGALRPSRPVRVHVVPLVGGLGQIAHMFQVHELARGLAEAFHGTWQAFYLPALAASDQAARELLRAPDARQVTAQWTRLDTAVVGVGNVDLGSEMQMLFADYISDDTLARLRAAHAVGDICMRFFDRNGRPCPDALRGVVGIDLRQLRRTRRVIGIAGGEAKGEALLGALRGRHLDVLITDQAAARRLLDLHRMQ